MRPCQGGGRGPPVKRTSDSIQPMIRHSCIACLAWSLLVILFSTGCQSPFQAQSSEQLQRAVEAAVDRELNDIPQVEPLQSTARPMYGQANEFDAVEEALAGRRDELSSIGPPTATASTDVPIGSDLLGEPAPQVTLGLRGAIRTAIENNLSIQAARLQQAITQAQLEQARAIFDATFFVNGQFNRSTRPNPSTPLLPAGRADTNTRTWRYDTGLRKPLVTGGQVELSTGLSRNNNIAAGTLQSPNPAYNSELNLALTQPLLRGFGSDVNRAQIMLARNQDRRSFLQLKQDLLSLVAQVEAAYWNLVLARQTMANRLWLVEVGVEVRDILERRRQFDTTLAQYADAVAVVQNRMADVIRAQRLVTAANDQLKQLINDPELTVGSEILIIPADWMVDAPLFYDLREIMVTALEESPLIADAILQMDDASIGLIVADNGRLPQLDLTAGLSYFGLGSSYGGAYSDIGDGTYVDYLVGLSFSQAIGNRAAESAYRAARLEQSLAVVGYRSSVQQLVFNVKGALRDVVTNYKLIQATRSFRLAQAENYRALLVDEQTLASLTPEFLNLKFQRQVGLAEAQRQEVSALIDYNNSLANLYSAMGVGLEMNQVELEVVKPAGTTNASN